MRQVGWARFYLRPAASRRAASAFYLVQPPLTGHPTCEPGPMWPTHKFRRDPIPRPATRRPRHFRTACRRHLCLLTPGNRCFGHPGKVVGQQVTWAGLHPLVEVGLFELAVVPSLHDIKILIADILDRVPEGLRNVGDVA